jgi:POT family proton-dependent oligopeptide transporter
MSSALSLLGTYAMMVYLTPILGGYLADKHLGYRNAVVIGALLMTLGHASMAVETELFLYLGITF